MIDLRELKDIYTLMAWRAEVIRDVFGEDADTLLLDANRHYYLLHIPDGSHIVFVASFDTVECGCGALCLSEELSSPDSPSANVLT